MNELLAVILSMSLSGGIVIMMLYLVLLLFQKKLCRQWQYYIWLIAIIRLVLPFAPQQNLMNTLFQCAKPSISSIESSSPETFQNEQEPPNVSKINKTVDNISDKELTGKSYDLSNVARQYLWLIWLLPAMILFARKVMTYKKTLQNIRAGSKEVQDSVLLEEFDKLIEKNHVRGRVALSVNNMIMSPVMVGLFHPCIILSTTQMTVLEFRHAVSHELVHYKRRDILYKWLAQLAVCIHWFNPLLYMMQRSINKACELSCDEVVIWHLDEQERYAYGDTLLRAAGRNVKCKLSVSPIAFSDNKKKLKERLDAIMNFKKISKATYFTMFSLAIILFVCSSYVGVYAAKRNVSETDTSKPETSKISVSDSVQASHSVVKKNGDYLILNGRLTKKEDEYTKWNIVRKKGIYYYKNKRIRALVETGKDHFFNILSYDKKGKVSIKVIRNSNNKITGVKYLPKNKLVKF